MNIYQVYNRILYKIFPHNCVCKHGPLTLTLQTVNRCTIKCKFCIRNSDEIADFNKIHKGQPDMSFETFQAIVDRYRAATSICLAGYGEPFLNKNLFEFIRYAREKGIKTSVISNGTILHKIFDNLVSSPPDSLSVSINVLNREEFREVAGVEDVVYDTVINNVSILAKNKPKDLSLRVSYVLRHANLKLAPDMIAQAKELGVNGIDFHNLIPYTECGNSFAAAVTDCSEDIKLLNKYKSVNWGVEVNFPTPISKVTVLNKCTRYFTQLHVSSGGYIGGCGRAVGPSEEFGHILDQNDPWNSQKMQKVRNKFLSNTVPFDICKTCVNVSPYYSGR